MRVVGLNQTVKGHKTKIIKWKALKCYRAEGNCRVWWQFCWFVSPFTLHTVISSNFNINISNIAAASNMSQKHDKSFLSLSHQLVTWGHLKKCFPTPSFPITKTLQLVWRFRPATSLPHSPSQKAAFQTSMPPSPRIAYPILSTCCSCSALQPETLVWLGTDPDWLPSPL